MKQPAILFLSCIPLLLGLCFGACGHHEQRNPAPLASTAAVGIRLEELEGSLGRANASVGATIENLSEADAKAIRIQEAIRNW